MLRLLILSHKLILERKLRRTDNNIRIAVRMWRRDPVAAERQYGHISDWDVLRLTDKSKLFMNARSFNEDLSKWQTAT